jgi:hypothetical protein
VCEMPCSAQTHEPGLVKSHYVRGQASRRIARSRSWVEGIQIIRRRLPSDSQLAIGEEEHKGNFESARFRDAMSVFFCNYLCRAKPFPPKKLLPAFKYMSEDKTVRDTLSVYSVTTIKSVLFSVLSCISNISPFTTQLSSYFMQSPILLTLSLTLLQSETITSGLRGLFPVLDLHSAPASNCRAEASV